MATQTDTETELAARFNQSLHQLCTRRRYRRLECAWAPSGYCSRCGRPIPTLLPNRPGTIT